MSVSADGEQELTVKWGSLLDAFERRVDFEHVRKVIGARRSELVEADTENNANLASGVLTLGCKQQPGARAPSSQVSDLFFLSPAARCSAAFSSSLLDLRLQALSVAG